MEGLRVHHIGYLVKNAEKSAQTFEKLGYKRGQGGYDPIQKADLLFLEMDGMVVELIAPKEDSDIYPLLSKYKNTAYHICYQVSDMEATMAELQSQGYALFMAPVKAQVIGESAKVCFLMNRNVGIIELVEM